MKNIVINKNLKNIKNTNGKRGITLIGLVITIIVLLILARCKYNNVKPEIIPFCRKQQMLKH